MILSIGVFCFGLLIGWITYRTLIRSTASAAIGDLATVIGAVGGAAVTAIAKPGTDLFGWYAIALLIGFASYGLYYRRVNGADKFKAVMAGETIVAGGTGGHSGGGQAH